MYMMVMGLVVTKHDRTQNSKGLDTKTSNSTQTDATETQQALTK
jgi:hypothetical protein